MKLWPFNKKINASLENPKTPLNGINLASAYYGAEADSGIHVNMHSAMSVSAVYACVRVLSETIASLPLHVYQQVNNGKEKITDNIICDLLHNAPNDNMTSYFWRECKITHLCLRGNAYAAIERNRRGQVKALLPLDPERMDVYRFEGRNKYVYTMLNGGQEIIDQDDILHFMGLSFDGLKGVSVIEAFARNSIGLARATEKHSGKLFKNGANPSVALKMDKQLSNEAYDRLKSSFAKAHQGVSNTGKTVILEEGMSVEKLSLTSDEAQLLETRRFQTEEIARIFRVPPSFIGDHTRSTFSNGEQQDIHFAKHTIRPWLVKIEQEINRKLFKNTPYFAEFSLDALMRGDFKSRMEGFSKGIQNSIYTPNEVRAFENLPPIDGGDRLVMQQNMAALTAIETIGESDV